MAKGKYEYWITEDGLLTIQGWARDGLTEEQIAHNIGISRETLRVWKDKFSAISVSIKKGKAPVDIQVENALLKRALGYDWEEVTTEMYGDGKKHIRKVTRHVPPDTAAAFIWLKNRKPQYWRDKPTVPEVGEQEGDGLIDALKGQNGNLYADGDDSAFIAQEDS